jgi:hypothetical protein
VFPFKSVCVSVVLGATVAGCHRGVTSEPAAPATSTRVIDLQGEQAAALLRQHSNSAVYIDLLPDNGLMFDQIKVDRDQLQRAMQTFVGKGGQAAIVRVSAGASDEQVSYIKSLANDVSLPMLELVHVSASDESTTAPTSQP